MKWHGKPEKNRGWKVKIDRPEEIYGNPEDYYTEEEIERYARSGGMRRAQQKIALRILQLLNIEEGSKLLDLGCGVGYTTEVYLNKGFEVVGLDILSSMLKRARGKRLRVIEGDMRMLPMLFKKEEFDAIVSASALQWLKEEVDISEVASGVYYVLKKGGQVVIQFYPQTEDELRDVFQIFKRNGFDGKIITDNPDNPKKRVVFLVMKKSP